jgi:NADH-quinone oxidoreductase subunit L
LDNAPEKVSILTKAARRDLFQDDFNEAALMRPGQSLVRNLLNIDYLLIDGLVRAVGKVSISTSNRLRTVQNGYVRSYALLMVIGALALITVIWAVTV